jgi:hypothetical protein
MTDWVKRFLVLLVACCGAALLLSALVRVSFALQGISAIEGGVLVVCLAALRVWSAILRAKAADGAIRPPVLALFFQAILRRRDLSPHKPGPTGNDPDNELQSRRLQRESGTAEMGDAARDAAHAAAPRKA